MNDKKWTTLCQHGRTDWVDWSYPEVKILWGGRGHREENLEGQPHCLHVSNSSSRQEVLCTCFSGCPDTMSFMDLLRHMHTLLCPPTRLIYSPGVRSSQWMRLPGSKSSTENTLGPVLKDLPFGLSTRKETAQLNTRLRATCSFFIKLINFIF